MWPAAFTLEQVIFSPKSQKNLFPKLFRRDAWFHKENVTSDWQRILEQKCGQPLLRWNKWVFPRNPRKTCSQNFFVEMHGSIKRTWRQTAKNTQAQIWSAAFTLEQVSFSLKSKKNLFPKLFQKAVTWLGRVHTVICAADRWRFDGFFESFFSSIIF